MTPARSKDVKVVPLNDGRVKPKEAEADPLAIPGLILAGSMSDREMMIPDGLEAAVMRHLGLHASGVAREINAPAFLVVQGPPGGGKSSNIRKCVTDAGCNILAIPASALASPYPGEGLKPLEASKVSVQAIFAACQKLTAIIIDDFDLSICAESPNMQFEEGALLLKNYIQGIGDDYSAWTLPDGATVPWFITCNDSSVFRGSLFREGRAQFYTHAPTFDERVLIVATMLDMSAPEAEQLVTQHPEQPIAWFATLKSRAVGDALDALMQRRGNDWQAIGKAMRRAIKGIGAADVRRAASAPLAAIKPESFLDSDKRRT